MRTHQLRCLKRILFLSFLVSIPVTPVFASRAGALDKSFGSGGIAFAQVPNMNAEGPRDILVQPDGKIIVVGSAFNFPNGVVSLARWNPNGSLDTGFGNSGVVITDLLPRSDSANSIALQADGKIVVAGQTKREIAGQKGYVFDIFVIRYNSDGSLDTSFDSDGIVFTHYSDNNIIDDIAVQPDGKILIGGNWGGGFLLIRYNSNGSLDTTFDGDGIATNPTFAGSITSMALQPDGKIVLAGSTHTDAVLARYNSNGTVDSSFDGDGIISIPIGISVTSYGTALQADGKILVTGSGRVNFPNRTELTLLRLNSNGSPDTGFDGDGLAVASIPGGTSFGDTGFDVRAQSDGKIIVIGTSSQNPAPVFAILRYQPNGSLDTSFDGDGIATPGSGGNAMAFQPDGKIIVGGAASVDGTFYDLSVSRFLIRGNTISDFDGDGKSDVSVFRPSNGVWYVKNSLDDNVFINQFGAGGDLITPADFDGDGKTDIAVFRPANGVWFILQSSNGTVAGNQFGTSGDRPVPGNYDADGRSDMTVFRPSTGTWWTLRSSDNGVSATHFGISEDKPAPGDFDGDGRSDLALFRPSNGVWYRLNSSNGAFVVTGFGLSGDKPVPADYDGDNKTDIAVFRPSTGSWYWINSGSGAVSATTFGVSEDRPSPADYDGDGKADRAVFRPSQGIWYLSRTTAGFGTQTFGTAGDIPTPNSFVE